MHPIIYILLNLVLLLTNNCNALKTIQDDDFMNFIRSETYVVVLFSIKDCEHCDQFDNAVSNIEDELSNLLNGPIVKILNSHLTRLYSPTKEPILVFFRHGIPLLYDGMPSEELIIHTFLNNKEPTVKELSDETFEHLTQAATGATTGDWFVMFYTSDCVDCLRLGARWEAVGAQLKSRMNVARINKGSGGSKTAARFKISQVPSFILFRHGKMYRYHIQKYNIASFISFAQDWYKNAKPEKIPLPKTPFDELIEKIVEGFHENNMVLKICIALSVVAAALLLLIKFRGQSNKNSIVTKQKIKDK